MQKTNFSRIIYQLNNLLFGFLSDTWKSKSIGLISVLTGYFLFANFLTKFISEGKNELIMVPIIIVFFETIIRIKPSSRSKFYYRYLVHNDIIINLLSILNMSMIIASIKHVIIYLFLVFFICIITNSLMILYNFSFIPGVFV